MKHKVKIILLVAVIIIALSFFLKRLKQPATYSVESTVFVDPQANKAFLLVMPAGESLKYPIQSPLTGGDAYPAYRCTKDGTIFGVANSNVTPKCPVCGSTEVVIPEIPSGKDNMDVPNPVHIIK